MPAVSALFLYDIGAKKDIRQIKTGETLYFSQLPAAFSFRADATDDTKSVQFFLNSKSNTENQRPFVCLGDTVPVMKTTGRYVLTATPWTESTLKGTAGKTVTITIDMKITPPTTSLLKGINYFNEYGLDQFKTIATDCAIKGIRTWECMRPTRKPVRGLFDWMRLYKNAGFKVTVVCTIAEKDVHANLPTAEQTKAWFSTAADVADGAVDAWEVGNEPNLNNYWPGSATEFRDRYMKPAYEALKAKNQHVIGASIAENTDKLKALVDLGYLDFCDEPSMHIYQTNVQKHIDAAKRTFDILKGHKFVATEWNIHAYWSSPKLTAQQWADALPFMLEGIRPYVTEAYYFQMSKNNSAAGVAGIMDKATRQKIEPFYSAYKNLQF